MKFFLLSFFVIFNLNASEFFENAKQDIVSPFTTNALTIVEIGGGLTLVSMFFKDALKNDLQKSISDHRPLKKYSKWGEFLGNTSPNILYSLLMGTDYWLNKDELSLKRSILMAKATLYSGALTDITKLVVNEKRPNGSNHSFPSGHTTSAFAFASVVMMEHSLPYGIAANAMASFVGFSRMNDNAHFLQDVLAGATIGTMYGVGLYYAQEKRDESKNSSVFLLVPTPKGLLGHYALEF